MSELLSPPYYPLAKDHLVAMLYLHKEVEN